MHQEEPFRPAGVATNAKIAGVVIAVGAALAVLAMTHHPEPVKVHGAAEGIAAIVGIASIDRVVHGAMIAIICALLFAFVIFSQRRGFDDATVVGGLVAYAIGAGSMIGAALLSGFLIPDIAERYAAASPAGMKLAVQMISICGAANQVLGKLGAIAMTVAILVWSLGLVRGAGAIRVAGIIGVAAAILAVAMLFIVGPYLSPQTLTVIVAGQGAWYFAVSALLLRGRV